MSFQTFVKLLEKTHEIYFYQEIVYMYMNLEGLKTQNFI